MEHMFDRYTNMIDITYSVCLLLRLIWLIIFNHELFVYNLKIICLIRSLLILDTYFSWSSYSARRLYNPICNEWTRERERGREKKLSSLSLFRLWKVLYYRSSLNMQNCSTIHITWQRKTTQFSFEFIIKIIINDFVSLYYEWTRKEWEVKSIKTTR